MQISPVPRAAVVPTATSRAPTPVEAVVPVTGNGPAVPVQPINCAASSGSEQNVSLADRRRDRPEQPAEQAEKAEVAQDTAPSAGHAPILALMRQAALACRAANASGDQGGGMAMAMTQAQGGLQVRGNLVVNGPDGFYIGSGQIYREGQLVAAFAGNNLALFGGRATTRM